jgi:hypothetical protein
MSSRVSVGAHIRRRGAVVCLGAAVALSGALLIGLDSHLTFIADDWMLLVKRQGWGSGYFLAPFHGSVVAGPAVVYRVLREAFGMDSSLPNYVVAIATFLGSAVLLFAYLRRRVPDWLALLAAILVLFLGAAFEDLLFAFQVGYFGSVAAGLGALIALDREDRRGDRVACAMLVLSLAFGSVGIAFVAGALADLALGRRPRARRAYVALVPLAVYGLWWIGWGHAAHDNVSIHNLVDAPRFVFDAAAAGITSLLGLATGDGSDASQPHLIWGKLLLVVGVVFLVLAAMRERELSRGLVVALSIALSFWVLIAINRDLSRLPTSSRYQYPSAVFLLLIAAEMLRGRRIPRPAYIGATVVTGLAVVGGVSLLHREYSERWVPYADSLRSTLTAVEIAGRAADPRRLVSFPPDVDISDRRYLATVRKHGSPAFGEAQLATRPAAERMATDLALAVFLDLRLTVAGTAEKSIRCKTLRALPTPAAHTRLGPGEFTLTGTGSSRAQARLGRFSGGYPVEFGPLEPGVEMSLTIPADESSRPWRLTLNGDGPVRLCSTNRAGARPTASTSQ